MIHSLPLQVPSYEFKQCRILCCKNAASSWDVYQKRVTDTHTHTRTCTHTHTNTHTLQYPRRNVNEMSAIEGTHMCNPTCPLLAL